MLVRTQAFEREICQVEELEDGGILGSERKRNPVGHTPGVRGAQIRRKSSGLGEGYPRHWKAAINQKGKSGRAGSLESKDPATQGPWEKG